jgi:hypothetical protein
MPISCIVTSVQIIPTTVAAKNGAKLFNLTEAELKMTVYRTFSRARFETLLKTAKNGLVRPSIWDDPFENFLLARSVVTEANGTLVGLESLAKAWYGQCWTLVAESDAMWRIYSPTKGGIRVAVKLQDLLDGLVTAVNTPSLQAFAGRVLYCTEAEIRAYVKNLSFTKLMWGSTNDRFAELLCVKREAFKHEEEVRLLFNYIDPPQLNNAVFEYPFNCSAVKDVMLDPRLTELDFNRSKSELNNIGLAVTPTQSTLYRVPNFTIPL